MLHRLSVDTLKKTAIYGAFLTATGCSVLYYLIQRKFAMSPYYRQSVHALKHHPLACKLLGEPLRFQAIRLGDEENWVTKKEAHIKIPVSGQLSAGYVRSSATFIDGSWRLNSVILDFKGRPQNLTIFENNNNQQHSTFMT